MPTWSWFNLHPKVVLGAIGGGVMSVLVSWLQSSGHPMPVDVQTSLVAFASALGGWLLPNQYVAADTTVPTQPFTVTPQNPAA